MKYKLIKEYPGSPKLGTITDRTMYFPEYYPSFWQPVVEKNYEILSLVASEKNPQHKKGSKFLHNKDYGFKNMYPTEFWDIYSVKRLSDGEIFTIGDKIQLDNDNKEFGTITELCISHEQLRFYCGRLGGVLCHDVDKRNNFTKLKQSLFTTEDAVDIFEGDNIYWVNINTFEKVNCNKFNDDLGEISIKSLLSKKYECKAIAFSTKEKAEEYILLNKPCLSYGEVQEYLKVKDCNKVLDLAQSKIQQSV